MSTVIVFFRLWKPTTVNRIFSAFMFTRCSCLLLLGHFYHVMPNLFLKEKWWRNFVSPARDYKNSFLSKVYMLLFVRLKLSKEYFCAHVCLAQSCDLVSCKALRVVVQEKWLSQTAVNQRKCYVKRCERRLHHASEFDSVNLFTSRVRELPQIIVTNTDDLNYLFVFKTKW